MSSGVSLTLHLNILFEFQRFSVCVEQACFQKTTLVHLHNLNKQPQTTVGRTSHNLQQTKLADRYLRSNKRQIIQSNQLPYSDSQKRFSVIYFRK